VGPLKFSEVLGFMVAVNFQMPLQIGLSAETTCTMRAPAKIVHVAFLIDFFFHHGSPSLG
jgi:hypothetical protein